MSREIKRTKQFKKDYKREKRNPNNMNLDNDLLKVIKLLATDTQLPKCARDHSLVGNWKDHRDCHIRADLVLIYRKPSIDSLELTRLGSHSELGI